MYKNIKSAFPGFQFKQDIPVGYLSIRVKEGKDVKDLEKSLQSCLENIMLMIQLQSQKKKKKYYYDSKVDPLSQVSFEFGSFNNKAYVLFNLNEVQMIQDFTQKLISAKKIIELIKPQFDVSLKSSTTFKDMISNKDKVKEITGLNKPNLLDFVLKGFSLSATCSVDKKIKSSLQGLITMILQDREKNLAMAATGLTALRSMEENPMFDVPEDGNPVDLSKIICDILIPETDQKITKTFRMKNPKQQMIEALGGSIKQQHIIDIYDLIDGAGPEFCSLQNKYLSQFPFILEFVEDLEEFGRADIKAGIINETISINVGMKTEGILETWEFFKSRLEYDDEEEED